MTTQKWGALASLVLAGSFVVPWLVYLTTPYPSGRVWYQVADFLSGPLWAATLTMAIIALRERVGNRAPRRMDLAQLAATFAGVFMISAAILRSVNRDYLELHTETFGITRVAIFEALSVVNPGLIATGWHCLGWGLLILGSVTWPTRDFPRGLSGLYLVSGILSLFAYLVIVYNNGDGPTEIIYGVTILLNVIGAVWQGIFLWRPHSSQSPAAVEGQQPS